MSQEKLFLRRKDLANVLQTSVGTIDNMRKEKLIPEPIQLSSRLVGWPSWVIEEWLITTWKESVEDYPKSIKENNS